MFGETDVETGRDGRVGVQGTKGRKCLLPGKQGSRVSYKKLLVGKGAQASSGRVMGMYCTECSGSILDGLVPIFCPNLHRKVSHSPLCFSSWKKLLLPLLEGCASVLAVRVLQPQFALQNGTPLADPPSLVTAAFPTRGPSEN